MCLDRVTKKYTKENKITGTGYVLMRRKTKSGLYRGLYTSWAEYRLDEESKAGNQPTHKSTLYGEYSPGFHIFKTLSDAKSYRGGLVQKVCLLYR